MTQAKGTKAKKTDEPAKADTPETTQATTDEQDTKQAKEKAKEQLPVELIAEGVPTIGKPFVTEQNGTTITTSW